MAFSMFSQSVLLLLVLLMAPSMGSSFVAKLSLSSRCRQGRFRQLLPLSTIRGGSSSDELNVPGSESTIPLQNSLIPPSIPESPPGVSLPLVSPTAASVVVSEVGISQKNFLGPNASPPGFLRTKFPDFPWHLVPNWLTYFRCLAVPLFVGVFYRPHSNIAASCLFAVASATDFLDGYLARKWDVTSAFGAFLDPIVSAARLLFWPVRWQQILKV